MRTAPASACDLSRGRWQRARGHLARRRRPANRHRSESGRGQEAPALAAGALVESEESARRVVLSAVPGVADTPAGDIDRVGVDCRRRDRGEAKWSEPERLSSRGGDRQHPGDGCLHGGIKDVSAQRRRIRKFLPRPQGRWSASGRRQLRRQPPPATGSAPQGRSRRRRRVRGPPRVAHRNASPWASATAPTGSSAGAGPNWMPVRATSAPRIGHGRSGSADRHSRTGCNRVTQQRPWRGAWVSLGRAGRANRSLRYTKMVDAPDAVLTLLGDDDQRFWRRPHRCLWGRPRHGRRCDRPAGARPVILTRS